MKKYSKDLFKILEKKELTIAIAESMTGGFIAASLVLNPGASKILKLSTVVYTEEAKYKVLGVSQDLMLRYTLLSGEVAEAMINGLKKLIKADIYLSITGNAGPTFLKNTDKLGAFIAVSSQDKNLISFKKLNKNCRQKNIDIVVKETFKILKSFVLNFWLLL